jgi:molybdopterin synthase sulfur carrier subunit
MAVVRIPSLMRDLTGGRATIEVPGRNVRQVIDALDGVCPGIKARLVDEGMLRPDLAIAVDGEMAEMGLLQPVGEHSELIVLPSIAGG